MAQQTGDHTTREYLDVQRVAELCKCHPETVYRSIRSGRLGVVNPNGEYVIRREDFEAWQADR